MAFLIHPVAGLRPWTWRRLERQAVAGHRQDVADALGRLVAGAPRLDSVELTLGDRAVARLVVGSTTVTLGGVAPAAALRLGEIFEPRVVCTGRYGRFWWLSFADPETPEPVTVAATHLAVTDVTGGIRPLPMGLGPAGEV